MKASLVAALALVACRLVAPEPASTITSTTTSAVAPGPPPVLPFPLARIADVPLPGGSTRFDYQAIDPDQRHLVIAHMNDASVLVLSLADGAMVKELTGIPTPRGVAVGDGRIFVTSSPAQLVLIDATSLREIARVETGRGPDGVAYDSVDAIVGVSEQQDGAVSLFATAGDGPRSRVPLGKETGNIVFDAPRGVFWVAVVRSAGSDQLVAVDPMRGRATTRIDLPGCSGAHGVALAQGSAFVACEGNDVLARVDLARAEVVATAPTGAGPDVLAIDPAHGWLYVAAEPGDLTVFDVARPGLAVIDRENVGPNAHTIAVDPSSHRVFVPLTAGANGTPVLRILRPRSW